MGCTAAHGSGLDFKYLSCCGHVMKRCVLLDQRHLDPFRSPSPPQHAGVYWKPQLQLKHMVQVKGTVGATDTASRC